MKNIHPFRKKKKIRDLPESQIKGLFRLRLHEQIKHTLFAQIRPELLHTDREFEQLKKVLFAHVNAALTKQKAASKKLEKVKRSEAFGLESATRTQQWHDGMTHHPSRHLPCPDELSHIVVTLSIHRGHCSAV